MENQITALAFPEKNTSSEFSEVKAGHIAIRTTEYDQTIKWYKDQLDFRLIHEWNVGETQLAFLALPGDNNFMIEIISSQNKERAGRDSVKAGYDHICFNVENLDKILEALRVRNIDIARCFSVPAIGKRVAFISDPFGNTIEFAEDIR